MYVSYKTGFSDAGLLTAGMQSCGPRTAYPPREGTEAGGISAEWPVNMQVRLTESYAIADRLAIERHTDTRAIEAEWRLLEATGIGAVFQRFDWVDAYVRHVVPHEGLEPAFLLGRLDGHAAFVLPLGIGRHGSLRIACWLGGSHSGYNFGLWSREGAEVVLQLGRDALEQMLKEALPGVDGAVLNRMPRALDGMAQPLAALSSLPSAVQGYSVSLEGGMDAVIGRTNGGGRRRRARSKERRMAEIGPIDHGVVRNPAMVREALDFFAEQKAQRLAEQGLPDPFAAPGVMDFLKDLADRSAGLSEPLLQISQYRVADKPRAVVGSGVHKGRVNVYILTLAHDETLPHSPGQVLMYRHIEESCEAGRKAFDFGIGYELYKESWADTIHQLVDGYAAFTPTGALALTAMRLGERTKTTLRRNERLWNALKALRRHGGAQVSEKDSDAG